MTALIRTTKEWFLVILCAIFLLSNFFPVAIEAIYPVVDTRGGNLMNMQTQKTIYSCGEMVQAQMIFQKQRRIVGEVRWVLVPTSPEGHLEIYVPRPAMAATGIYNVWVDIEKLPKKCEPGRYHFEGVITYPLIFGKATYNLRTTCFEVKP